MIVNIVSIILLFFFIIGFYYAIKGDNHDADK